MNKRQRITVIAGLAFIFLVTIFPPRHFTASQNGVKCSIQQADRFSVSNLPFKIDKKTTDWGQNDDIIGKPQIDYPVLIWNWAAIGVFTAIMYFTFHRATR